MATPFSVITGKGVVALGSGEEAKEPYPTISGKHKKNKKTTLSLKKNKI